jgi:general secretion pathway protein I
MIRSLNQCIKNGFTLIEVMLAMAVFAIAGVALLGAAQNNFDSMSLLEQKTVANWVASNQLVAATLDDTWPPKNNRKGEVEMAGSTWHWLQKVERTQDSQLRQITIEVRKNQRAESAITEMVTFVSKPDSK